MTVPEFLPRLSHAGQVTPVRAAPGRLLNAPARYHELEFRHRRLLVVLAAYEGEVPEAMVAAASRLPVHVARGWLIRLSELGMVRQLPGGWQLEEAVTPLAKNDLAQSVHIALMLPRPDLLRAPGGSHTERRVFLSCLELFAPSPVLLGVPLAHLIDPDAAASHLGAEDLAFLNDPRTQLDIVVCSPALRPVLAIEADGPQHDVSPQVDRDRRKNRICRVAGLPLARLRVRPQLSDESLRHHLARLLSTLARETRLDQRGHAELARALSRLA
ncbi:hypothetical protein GCM10008956_32350 [Deinococcus arenae]|uniref:DUF2726 domain-containing protein n=1 Tax=Deinococcus arenae TaxID=1452751 RepID=A0A8H9GS74_9DEIO|nr:DUF2726 domain-containing protein [Deinococcus arenae]GGM53967.1 hypothetical protein GCM10008956_32350 [Deinococcus arenae]